MMVTKVTDFPLSTVYAQARVVRAYTVDKRIFVTFVTLL